MIGGSEQDHPLSYEVVKEFSLKAWSHSLFCSIPHPPFPYRKRVPLSIKISLRNLMMGAEKSAEK